MPNSKTDDRLIPNLFFLLFLLPFHRDEGDARIEKYS
uniref:Uncharacterized protein n=1 Tax=Anguilla anguilla TaxID=7936 RepID=A0A0E9WHK2_ANGAN